MLSTTQGLTFLSSAGDSLTSIRIAVARTEEETSQGLMDVKTMAENEGMLFIFETTQPRSFWMANTPLSLDMLFIDESYIVARIHTNTTPYSQNSYASGVPVRYVVEVNAGFTLKHDITEGATIRIHD